MEGKGTCVVCWFGRVEAYKVCVYLNIAHNLESVQASSGFYRPLEAIYRTKQTNLICAFSLLRFEKKPYSLYS